MSRTIFVGLVALAVVAGDEVFPAASQTLRGGGQEGQLSARLLQDALPVCGNGIVGIHSSDFRGDVCCAVGCGLCGGVGCSQAGGPDLGAEACCVTEIKDFGELCSIKGEAPCIINPNDDEGGSADDDEEEEQSTDDDAAVEYCSNGIPGVESSYAEYCCEAACGACGGPGCGDFAEGYLCCVTDIAETGVMCSASNAAPCIIDGDVPTVPPVIEVCINGIEGVESIDGYVCCAESCDECSEATCAIDGDNFDPECCYSLIVEVGEACDELGVSPCMIGGDDDDTSTTSSTSPEVEVCSNGIDGIESEDGSVCCAEFCDECSEKSCAIDGDDFDVECCASLIEAIGEMCDELGVSPCVINDERDDGSMSFSYSYSPTPASTSTTAPVGMEVGDVDGNGEIDGYAYEGCFENPVEDPFLMMTTSDEMTPELCFEMCAMEPGMEYLYMGLLEGSKCGCGNDPHYALFNGQEGTCDSKCSGSESHTCGGSTSYEQYRLVDSNIGMDDDDTTGGLLECSNGIPGVESESGDVCCSASCGSCGGSRCVGTGGCCEEYIKENDEDCDVAEVAPCVIKRR